MAHQIKSSSQWRPDQIVSTRDVRAFLSSVIIGDRIGVAFHPDTPFEDYMDIGDGSVSDAGVVGAVHEATSFPVSGVPRYALVRSAVLNDVMERCFDVVEADVNNDMGIYEMYQEIWRVTGVTQ